MSMSNPRAGGDPEMVLRQALRSMAGGRRPEPGSVPPAPRRSALSRLTTPQILLIAAIIGVVLGMAAAFAVLLTR